MSGTTLKPCIYCRAPWSDPDLWPVTAGDLADGNGFGCVGCGHQFAIGEFYGLRPCGAYDGVVCLGCDVADVAVGGEG